MKKLPTALISASLLGMPLALVSATARAKTTAQEKDEPTGTKTQPKP
jgi:hypothetical protein